ncbi:hypothetical protein EF847_17905 [Actinobacteria bacterium YIM 96077]|uniref:Sec-independent protein translocase protein TatB n=1 Tax=Phytoactinopolyspora halophila TaxID=1981511 RepID=A0A329QR57_9ACTN|nr:twin-arginine translocase TatA/TatE family subunit [Phytoactinopolyspora halophila]AYY14293.1 hypothetical protein EF847_17905 [Actinobacteria bacterium YIM 96077]RAW14835.1 hypothetical protein DPM12_10120 [Phytoactinopolyspora halophila]
MSEIGVAEIAVILVVALLVFGPDRLPVMIKQAAAFVRDLRTMVANARRDLSSSVSDMGIDQEDLRALGDLRNPRSFVRQNVLDGADLNSFGFDEFEEVGDDLDITDKRSRQRRANGKARNGSANGSRTREKSESARGSGTTQRRPSSSRTRPSERRSGARTAEERAAARANTGTTSEAGAVQTASADANASGGVGAGPEASTGSSAPAAPQRFDPDTT